MSEVIRPDKAEIINTLKNITGLELAILFGSFASGKVHAGSDIDLAIALEKPIESQRLAGLAGQLSLELKREIDLHDLHTSEGLIFKKIMTTGKLIINNNPAMYDTLFLKCMHYISDFLPYQMRIFDTRRMQWIKK